MPKSRTQDMLKNLQSDIFGGITGLCEVSIRTSTFHVFAQSGLESPYINQSSSGSKRLSMTMYQLGDHLLRRAMCNTPLQGIGAPTCSFSLATLADAFQQLDLEWFAVPRAVEH